MAIGTITIADMLQNDKELRGLLERTELARSTQKVSDSAARNLAIWLTEPRYAEYVPLIANHIHNENWKALDDAGRR